MRSPTRPATLPRAGLLLALLAIGPGFSGCSQEPSGAPASLHGETMGTTWSVRLANPVPPSALTTLRARIEGKLETVDLGMSTWRPDSELSRFNASQSTEAMRVSPDLFLVLEEAVRVGRMTGGAFDVTVGPLVNAFGFGPEAVDEPPSAGELAELGERTGLGLLELDRERRTARKHHPRLYLDLSGIAKGHAVDRIAEALAVDGYDRYMVEVGGEVRALGANPEGAAWRIGVERPDGSGGVMRIVPLPDLAMATSGDYRNFRIVGGERLTHIFDPRTGRSVHHRLASATVLHERCVTADALATAMMALGPEDAMALAEREDLAVLLLLRAGDGFEERLSTALARRLPG